MNSAADVIRAEIVRSGAVSFARFMELALYAPGTGYYERHPSIGRRGDFFTSASVGPLFGEILAFQFGAWFGSMPPGPWQIVEAGAHDGRLAADVLAGLARFHPDVFAQVEYWIIEPSAARQAWQRTTLRAHLDRVRWFRDWADVPAPGVHGVVFSNELLDAMPIHRLAWCTGRRQWAELGVGWDGARFVWRPLAEVTPALVMPAWPEPVLNVLPDGFIVELCPEAARWWSSAAGRLGRGRLLAIDYGLEEREFISPARSDGTLRAYSRHRLAADPLGNPGDQDLTAHVDFTALQRAGEAAGLVTESFVTQSAFLHGVLRRAVAAPERFGAWDTARTRAFQTLTHPEHLGRAFRVLIQSRD